MPFKNTSLANQSIPFAVENEEPIYLDESGNEIKINKSFPSWAIPAAFGAAAAASAPFIYHQHKQNKREEARRNEAMRIEEDKMRNNRYNPVYQAAVERKKQQPNINNLSAVTVQNLSDPKYQKDILYANYIKNVDRKAKQILEERIAHNNINPENRYNFNETELTIEDARRFVMEGQPFEEINAENLEKINNNELAQSGRKENNFSRAFKRSVLPFLATAGTLALTNKAYSGIKEWMSYKNKEDEKEKERKALMQKHYRSENAN